jgi:hypothetical protein
VYAGAAQLTGAINPLLDAVRNLPDALVPVNLENEIDPAIAAVQEVLPQPGEVCPKVKHCSRVVVKCWRASTCLHLGGRVFRLGCSRVERWLLFQVLHIYIWYAEIV